jgi:hypothetical protein
LSASVACGRDRPKNESEFDICRIRFQAESGINPALSCHSVRSRYPPSHAQQLSASVACGRDRPENESEFDICCIRFQAESGINPALSCHSVRSRYPPSHAQQLSASVARGRNRPENESEFDICRIRFQAESGIDPALSRHSVRSRYPPSHAQQLSASVARGCD